MLKCPKCFVVLKRVEINDREFDLCVEDQCNFFILATDIKIQELHMLIGVDDDGNEAIPAFESEGKVIPLIATSPNQLPKLLRKAPYLREAFTSIKLLKFSHREEVKFTTHIA